ncbi:MAG: hypothetical protein GX091_01310 [Peptococcaceae bacterium]|mgnify:CR=1 FL=1|nr:hypothetical protein [Peptococcaceae bacterium]
MTKYTNQIPKYIICIIILILLLPSLLWAKSLVRDSSNKNFSLILDSNLVDCTQASVKYIVWTQDENGVPVLEKILEQTGMPWEKNVLINYWQNRAYEYIAQMEITGGQEADMLEKYLNLKSKLKNLKQTKVFMEEIVAANLDINDFLSRNNVVNFDRIEAFNTISATGYVEYLNEGINIGGSPVNFQIITRTNNLNPGRTIIAFPALWKEF